MGDIIYPSTAAEVLEVIGDSVASKRPLEVLGAGSRRGLGRPTSADVRLELRNLSGIEIYEPSELVLTALAGTPLSEIESALATNRQQLAFEPPDFGLLYSSISGQSTIGGVIATNSSGPSRFQTGAARDHFLGFEAVTGRAEKIKSGGRVVKNVTGFDLPKLIAGSYGTLAVMTKITLKVLPRPEFTRTLLIYGAEVSRALVDLKRAVQSPFGVNGAAYLSTTFARRSSVDYVSNNGDGVTAIRIQGHKPSVESRLEGLRKMYADRSSVEELHGRNSTRLWSEIRDISSLAGENPAQIWRLSLPPRQTDTAVRELVAQLDGKCLLDWGGGLLWFVIRSRPDAGQQQIHKCAQGLGGHATLYRAADHVRREIPVFSPQSFVLAALTKRLKNSFDPHGLLNPGRMYADT